MSVCVFVCMSAIFSGGVLLHPLSSTCNIQCYLSVHMDEELFVNLEAVDRNSGLR